jgi:imidazolonepropionase-like amidohydrolase
MINATNFIRFFFLFVAIVVLTCCSIKMKSTSNEEGKLLVLQDLTLIDGTGSPLKKHVTIVIKNGKIIEITDVDKVINNNTSTVINLEGKYVIPGMIDGHVHVADVEFHGKAKRKLKKMFSQGITNVRDMVGKSNLQRKLRKESFPKNSPMPRLYYAAFVAGPKFIATDPRFKIGRLLGIDLDKAPGVIVIKDSTNISLEIKKAKDFGVNAIKLYEDIPSHLAKKLIKEAKKQGLQVWSHASVGDEGPLAVVGADCLSHAAEILICDSVNYLFNNDFKKVLTSPETTKLFVEMRKNDVVFDVTLGVVLLGYSKYEDWEDEYSTKIFALYDAQYELTSQAYKIGVPIGVGTDGAGDIADEMELLVTKVNIPELQVIKSATYNNALALGIEKDYGSIEVGKIADLVILNNNPLENIANVRDIKYVIKDGYLYSK